MNLKGFAVSEEACRLLKGQKTHYKKSHGLLPLFDDLDNLNIVILERLKIIAIKVLDDF